MIDVKLFDTIDCKIKKSKGHSIEFDGEVFHWRANFLTDQNIEGVWKERWRCWHETFYKKAVVRYGYLRIVFTSSTGEEQWCWEFKISLAGVEDVVMIFESKEDVIKFQEEFTTFMNAK